MDYLTNEEWLKFLNENPTNDEFIYLMKYTNCYKNSWDILKEKNLSNDELIDIICFNGYRTDFVDINNIAFEILSKRNPTNDSICFIIFNTKNDIIRNKAVDLILNNTQFLSEAELCCILNNIHTEDLIIINNILLKTPDEILYSYYNKIKYDINSTKMCDILDDMVAKILLEKENITNDILLTIIRNTQLKNEAAKILLEQSPSNDELIEIIKKTDLKNEAANILFSRNLTINELYQLVICNTVFKNKAAQLLLNEKNVPNNILIEILNSTNFNYKIATLILKNNPNNNDLLYIIKYVDDIDILYQVVDMLLLNGMKFSDIVHYFTKYNKFNKDIDKYIFDKEISNVELVSMLAFRKHVDNTYALRKLLNNNPTNEHLKYVVHKIDDKILKYNIIDTILKNNPTTTEIEYILRDEKLKEYVLDFAVKNNYKMIDIIKIRNYNND